MDRKEELILKTLHLWGELYNKQITPAVESVWVGLLKGYPLDDLKRAFEKVIKTCKFFPTPAEVIEMFEGTEEERALVAFDKLKTAIQKHGAYTSVKFDDPAIHTAIEMLGGWVEVCFSDERFLENRFKQAYRVARKKTNHPKYLPELIEMESGQELKERGLPIPRAFVGHKIKALKGKA